jgi:hypothetical protein
VAQGRRLRFRAALYSLARAHQRLWCQRGCGCLTLSCAALLMCPVPRGMLRDSHCSCVGTAPHRGGGCGWQALPTVGRCGAAVWRWVQRLPGPARCVPCMASCVCTGELCGLPSQSYPSVCLHTATRPRPCCCVYSGYSTLPPTQHHHLPNKHAS